MQKILKFTTTLLLIALSFNAAFAGSAFQSTLQSSLYYFFSSDGSGNVGFGTTVPNGLLDVRGTICMNGGADCRTTWPSSDTNIWTKNVNDAYYTDGLVGIGVTNPDTSLNKRDQHPFRGRFKIKMKIITDSISLDEIKQMAKQMFGNMVKVVVDIDKKIIAIDGELHADEEALLLENDSKQQNQEQKQRIEALEKQ